MAISTYWGNKNINHEPLELQGMQHTATDLIIIDDFLDDPYTARDLILKQHFEPPPNPKAGVISFNAEIPDCLYDEMLPKLEKHIGKKVQYHPRSKCAATFESIPTNSVCHVDGGDNMVMFNWTVVVYLNLPEQCQGGTVFFKHKRTGHTYNKYGIAYYGPDFRNPEKWELVNRANMKFNRAALCPAWLFHSLEFTFGNHIQNARLTLNPKVVAY